MGKRTLSGFVPNQSEIEIGSPLRLNGQVVGKVISAFHVEGEGLYLEFELDADMETLSPLLDDPIFNFQFQEEVDGP